MTHQPTVAVLGAGGIMGFAMARNLARAGHPVRAWNRSTEKAQPLADDGAVLASSPAEAAHGADVVVTMLADAEATEAVAFGDDGAFAEHTAGGVTSPPVWLQMGTLGAHGTAVCMEEAARRDLPFLDAPVVGTKQPAIDGKLTILASGDRALEPAVAPLLDVIGAKTIWVGGAGAGTQLKLVVNSWVLSIIESVAETAALAEGVGIELQTFLDVVAGGPLDLPYLQLKGGMIADGDFSASFPLAGAAKDARLIVELGERHGLELPLHRTLRERLAEAVDDHGAKDAIATYLTSRPA
ncbi:MAG: NAD(P)-dependent oxidoreductase [Solirubrobacteraceae bacterium]|nr:NAD(P)-dependent oxidoreductase [Solirubrobacteraceae bacterium]